jgi:hypothetical protein
MYEVDKRLQELKDVIRNGIAENPSWAEEVVLSVIAGLRQGWDEESGLRNSAEVAAVMMWDVAEKKLLPAHRETCVKVLKNAALLAGTRFAENLR